MGCLPNEALENSVNGGDIFAIESDRHAGQFLKLGGHNPELTSNTFSTTCWPKS